MTKVLGAESGPPTLHWEHHTRPIPGSFSPIPAYTRLILTHTRLPIPTRLLPGSRRTPIPAHTRSYPPIPAHTRSYPAIPRHTHSVSQSWKKNPCLFKRQPTWSFFFLSNHSGD